MISLAVPNSEEVGNEQGDVQWFYVHGNEISFIGNSLELIDAGTTITMDVLRLYFTSMATIMTPTFSLMKVCKNNWNSAGLTINRYDN